MTLDEPSNWRHAEQLERDDFTPDPNRAVTDWLGEQADFLSERARVMLAAKILAQRGVFAQWFSEVEPEAREARLQWDPRHRPTAVEHYEELLHELERERDATARLLAEARAGHVDRYSPDELAADEDDARLSRDRAAENVVGPNLGGTAA